MSCHQRHLAIPYPGHPSREQVLRTLDKIPFFLNRSHIPLQSSNVFFSKVFSSAFPSALSRGRVKGELKSSILSAFLTSYRSRYFTHVSSRTNILLTVGHNLLKSFSPCAEAHLQQHSKWGTASCPFLIYAVCRKGSCIYVFDRAEQTRPMLQSVLVKSGYLVEGRPGLGFIVGMLAIPSQLMKR